MGYDALPPGVVLCECDRCQLRAYKTPGAACYCSGTFRVALPQIGALDWLIVVALIAWSATHRGGAGAVVTFGFIGALVSAIVAVFGYIADKAVTIAVTIAQAAIMIGTAIAHFAIAVGGVFLKIGGLLARFWSAVLQPSLTYLWKQVVRFEGWLQRTFKPVIDAIDWTRKHVQQIYDKWFRPIFDTIDTMRRILQLLAVFRLEWARDLDRKLAALEDRMLAPMREIMRRLNEASNWVNRIVTLDGLFQRLTLIKSLVTYQRDALKVWWHSIHRPMTDAERDAYKKAAEAKPIAAVRADWRAYVEDRRGPDAARIDEHAADLALRLRVVNGVSP